MCVRRWTLSEFATRVPDKPFQATNNDSRLLLSWVFEMHSTSIAIGQASRRTTKL